ncbi:MAG: DNA circularization N-terminal domain-containing protein [Nitrospiraceae bacterium]|nr:DNA circularization N-terminal domain-containing protein [Nitrospiraceae bacterium]
MPDTYQAQLGPFNLDIQDIEDTFEKAIATYEFPYVDGALLEDMGQKARKIKFRCYFYNDTYQTHFDLINYLEYRGMVDLVHPKYGLVKGKIESVNVRHDDRIRMAQIDIAFTENLRGSAQPIATVQVQGAVEDAFASGQQDQMDWFSSYTSLQIGAEGAAVLAQTLDYTQPGVLSQFTGLSQKAQAYMARVDTYVRTLDGTLLDVTNPANGLVSVLDYGTTLPGRVVSAVARTIERYAVLCNTAGCAPSRFLNNLQQAIGTLAAASGDFADQTQCAGAQRLALETSYIYDADEQNYAAQKQAENQKAFDTMGNYTALASLGAVLTVEDLEATLAIAMSAIEASITAGRLAGELTPSLKTQALALLTWVEQVKMERATVITIGVANPTPMHLLCLQYGLDYHAAERVFAINKIKQPSFTQGTINMYSGGV